MVTAGGAFGHTPLAIRSVVCQCTARHQNPVVNLIGVVALCVISTGQGIERVKGAESSHRVMYWEFLESSASLDYE